MGKAKDNAKRVAILIAVGGFIFSSVAVTILAVMSSKNENNVADQQQELLKQIQEQQMNKEPRQPLMGYNATTFVTELKVETLKEGDGATATAESSVNANYFGWTSDGEIFDSTQKGDDASPIEFPLSGVIEGWTKGLTGAKQGSVVRLTIPAEMAYGAEDDGSGRPFGPLMFIVELKEVK
jgi:FKBP-type peptidyl-prolyl cis-trans isomerase